MFDWNDARYFLAVAESGSTLSAGRRLHVSQTTVARRIAALEAALGLTLFDRRRDGYALTPEAEALLPEAGRIAAAASDFADAAALARRAAGGTVRLTTDEAVAVGVLPPMLRELHDLHPDILIDLDASREVRDLSTGAADIAIRITPQPEGPGLVGRRVATDHWTVYCSRGYAEAHAIPRRVRELRDHPLISVESGVVGRYYRAWLREHDLESAIAMMHGTMAGVLAAVRSGLGLAAMPCLIAELDPDLVRCLRVREGNSLPVWLLTHERLQHAPRVRIVLDFLAERLAAHSRAVEARLASD